MPVVKKNTAQMALGLENFFKMKLTFRTEKRNALLIVPQRVKLRIEPIFPPRVGLFNLKFDNPP